MGKASSLENLCGAKWRDSPGGLGWWCPGKPSPVPRVFGGWSGLETGCSRRLVVPVHVPELEKRCRLCWIGFLHLFPLQIHTDGLMSFGVFGKCFCKNSFASLPIYKEAIFQIIEVRDPNTTKDNQIPSCKIGFQLCRLFCTVSLPLSLLCNFFLAHRHNLVCSLCLHWECVRLRRPYHLINLIPLSLCFTRPVEESCVYLVLLWTGWNKKGLWGWTK